MASTVKAEYVALRIEKSVKKQIAEMAKKERRTLSNMASLLLTNALKAQTGKSEAA